MKTVASKQRNGALTLVEFVVVLFSLFILAILLLPALSAPRVKNALGCMNQLKRTGSAVRVWEGDQADKYSLALTATNGGGVAENIFAALSNELRSTKVLICPADRNRLPASSFRTLTSRNISYFVNLDANEADPQDILMGDDNLMVRGIRVKSGVFVVSNNFPIAWTADRHRFCGNLAMADGSVLAANNFTFAAYQRSTNTVPATNTISMRLAIP